MVARRAPAPALRVEPARGVAGVDEAGRGALAGPVVAAACIWDPAAPPLPGVRDSKELTARRREELYEALLAHPAARVGVGVASGAEVDGLNVLRATMAAMARAVAALPGPPPAAALIDGNCVPDGLPCPAEAVVGGDRTRYCIAAASIVAKVTRDRRMRELHAAHPEYGFDQHAGYGTAKHVAAMREHGATPHHRTTFAPLRGWRSAASD